ncbi:uncharacterized protein LOC135461536 isoform X1 [Liolophura sinensis]|uniref:uncharacterized protein LOC135461536 isoform X1 n=1 Tax=Liolophura sinensis TaxID=3198878 RepID=UPI00315881E0
MATAYHQEALRKQRILERKKEAAIRMEAERQGIFEPGPALPAHSLNPPVQTDTYGTNRPGLKPDIMDDALIFSEITHDPNFKFRIRKDEKEPPIHVNPIYRIMYPNALRVVNPSDATQ